MMLQEIIANQLKIASAALYGLRESVCEDCGVYGATPEKTAFVDDLKIIIDELDKSIKTLEKYKEGVN